jgi:Mg2+ and Co2+ transporter CorA
MASGIDYGKLPQNSKLATQALDIEKNDKELERKLGYIGKIFGHGNNVVLYIVALITIFLVFIGAIYSFYPINEGNMPPVELWKILTPFITTGMGFIAGKSGKLKAN